MPIRGPTGAHVAPWVGSSTVLRHQHKMPRPPSWRSSPSRVAVLFVVTRLPRHVAPARHRVAVTYTRFHPGSGRLSALSSNSAAPQPTQITSSALTSLAYGSAASTTRRTTTLATGLRRPIRPAKHLTSRCACSTPRSSRKLIQQLQQSRLYYGFNSSTKGRPLQRGRRRRDHLGAQINLWLARRGSRRGVESSTHLHARLRRGIAAYGNQLTSDGLHSTGSVRRAHIRRDGTIRGRVYFGPGSPTTRSPVLRRGSPGTRLPDDTAVGGRSPAFTGSSGPSSNTWNKLLYAIKFGSTITFSSRTEAPRILFQAATRCCAWPGWLLENGTSSHLPSGRRPCSCGWSCRYEQPTFALARVHSRTRPWTPVHADEPSTCKNNKINYMRNSVEAVSSIRPVRCVCSALGRDGSDPAYLGEDLPRQRQPMSSPA